MARFALTAPVHLHHLGDREQSLDARDDIGAVGVHAGSNTDGSAMMLCT